MTNCNGAPAEQSALAYVEGSLPEAEAERFEEHFFECEVCLEYLQTIQATGSGLAKMPPAAVTLPPRQKVLAWPRMTWAIGSAAAALLLIAFGYRYFASKPSESTSTASVTTPVQTPVQTATQAQTPAPAAQPVRKPSEPTTREKPVELAELTLPVFVAPHLRGDSEDEHFQTGMKAYASGDCVAAREALKQVAADSGDSRAAKFYSGVCAMKVGDLTDAAATLRAVADAGDSPQQESAYYYLAQVELANGDAAAAHRTLQLTIALKGDLERKATVQDRKVVVLMAKTGAASALKVQ